MLPSERKAFIGSAPKKCTMCIGFTAARTPGCCTICPNPSTPSTLNHTTITGPNTLPIAPVPRRCTMNSANRMTQVSGMTIGVKASDATRKPSTALSTEMAGVMSPSPYSKAVPNTPRSTSTPASRLFADVGMISAINARMPPSPWFSARITTAMYLMEMITMSAQNASEAMPIALVRVTSRC